LTEAYFLIIGDSSVTND